MKRSGEWVTRLPALAVIGGAILALALLGAVLPDQSKKDQQVAADGGDPSGTNCRGPRVRAPTEPA